MVRHHIVGLGISLLVSLGRSEEPGKQAPELKTLRERASYSIGTDIGKNMKNLSFNIDPDLLARGIKDAVTGAPTLLSKQEIAKALADFKKDMMARQEGVSRKKGEENQKAGAAFMAENGKKEGVISLPSGLQYKVLKQGTGGKAKPTDTVEAHYEGTLIDGTVFDSSYSRGQPVSFQVSRVVKGWQEALSLMPVGSKWQLFIPPALAYGARGAGKVIGPNATLIFDIELMSVKKP